LLRSLPRFRHGFALRPASAQADGGRSYDIIDAKLWALRRCERNSPLPVCTILCVDPVGDLGGKPCVIQLVTTRPAAALWQTEYPPARTEVCEKCRQWRRSSQKTAGMISSAKRGMRRSPCQRPQL
jgi:hypothetical protein